MKIGFNLLLWTTNLGLKDFHLLEKLKKAGYDGVEVPIFEGSPEHYHSISELLKNLDLECTGISVIPDEEHNPISSNKSNRNKAKDFLRWAVDCNQALNSKIMCGPFHQPLAQFSGIPPTTIEKENGSEVHKEVANYAKKFDITLCIEPLNRFECYFLNTIKDTYDYVKLVNEDNFKILYDTFHSNIEEKDPVGSISKFSDKIGHIHISENDRGVPGKGNIPWSETFQAIKKINYKGWLTIEAFGRSLPDLAAATKVWRDFFSSEEEVYQEGLNFIKKNL
tara:strand:+ start:1801 stop:2640 length:840 start_codon:yes stop_codon:yes gene_type:complete